MGEINKLFVGCMLGGYLIGVFFMTGIRISVEKKEKPSYWEIALVPLLGGLILFVVMFVLRVIGLKNIL